MADPHVGPDVGAWAGPFPTYFGSKAGCWREIVRRFPPHSVYVEAFLGGGAVLRYKPPALASLAIDSDGDVITRWRRVSWPGVELVHGDAVEWLARPEVRGWLPPDALVYADPPYVHSTRSSARRYRCEMTDDAHARLLSVLEELDCSVVVSGYRCGLYDGRLTREKGWKRWQFQTMTRGGLRTEAVWARSSPAVAGVVARYVGAGWRDRERVNRKAARWRARFVGLGVAEREAVLRGLLGVVAGDHAGCGEGIWGAGGRPR